MIYQLHAWKENRCESARSWRWRGFLPMTLVFLAVLWPGDLRIEHGDFSGENASNMMNKGWFCSWFYGI